MNTPLWRIFLLFLVAGVASDVVQSPRKKSSQRRPQTTQKPKPVDDDEISDDCPEPDGFFADAYQCDKYYECQEGAIVAEKLCPDGMVFSDFSPVHEKCDLPFNIDCSQRSELQAPQPTLHCRRKNGYFSHEEANVCDKFYYCVDGKFNMITCPDGLVYNEKTGICTWPDEAKKKGCSSQDVFQFRCPNVTSAQGQQHPRYADPQDCQYFYVCINGETPRRNGCKMGQVFNDIGKICDWPRNVAECKDWYKGILTDAELDALEHPKPKVKDEAAYRTRHGVRTRHREEEEEEEEEK